MNDQTIDMNLIPTDVLLKALVMRSDKFAIAYKLPSDDEMSVIMLHGTDYYSSLGLAMGLLENMREAPLRDDGVWDDEPED